MISIRRNQIIITALVVMIAIAGYLNYVDTRSGQEKITLNDQGEINALIPGDDLTTYTFTNDNGEIGDALTMEEALSVEDAMVFDDPTISMDGESSPILDGAGLNLGEGNHSAEPGEAVFVNSTQDSSYFVQAKLEREQSRSKQKDILMGMINDSKLDADKKTVCADAMLEIQNRIEKETAAEAMIEAKGFKEVYVRIDDKTVDVVVNKEALSDAEIAQIEDIVKRKTGMEADQIRITPMKK